MVDVDRRERVHRAEGDFVGELEAAQLGDGLRGLRGAALADQDDRVELLATRLLGDDGDLSRVGWGLACERRPPQAGGRAFGCSGVEVKDRAVFGSHPRGDPVLDEALRAFGLAKGLAVDKSHGSFLGVLLHSVYNPPLWWRA